MTYILEIGDRRRLKAGIRVLHHAGHRAPCSGERLNFAEARRATTAQPSPSEEDSVSLHDLVHRGGTLPRRHAVRNRRGGCPSGARPWWMCAGVLLLRAGGVRLVEGLKVLITASAPAGRWSI